MNLSRCGNCSLITVRSLSRRKVLKAFLKSILSRIRGFHSLAFVKYVLAACTAPSHPAFVSQPSCTGLNLFPNVLNMRTLTALATTRRKVFPMAMGRTPPSGLRRAIRLAPKKIYRLGMERHHSGSHLHELSSIVVVGTEIGLGELSGGDGICRSWGGGGCRSLIASKVTALTGASVASEHKTRTAPETSPSDNFFSTEALMFRASDLLIPARRVG